jgi:hypothetical protein
VKQEALAKQQPLCDNQFRPYLEGFQEAYRAGQVLEYVRAGRCGCSDVLAMHFHVMTAVLSYYNSCYVREGQVLECVPADMCGG